ncbi:oxidoreductase C-terminal domain-containing protein [Streptomyces sp. HG99]|uniref:oxidoreductase C-terminal domain-containing protein n=2 Tax=Streptomyces TaxID=1883 RepID=UPI0027B9105A|nr:oxidoreductase C-terminal domain-containing protein [Streptomyces sp. HG99]
MRGAAVLAANILGGDRAFDPVPYFWSDQFGRRVQYAGRHEGADSLIWQGDPASDQWAACWLRDGSLAALVTVDRPRDMLQVRRLIESGTPVDLDRLGDPAVPLKSTTL